MLTVRSSLYVFVFIRIWACFNKYILYFNIIMGKKGVLLDNGKVAQSSMALYWKAGQKKGGKNAEKAPVQEKQQDIESRAGNGMEKWKQHKQKMISKLYAKPQKKDAQATSKELQQKQRKMQEEMDRQLLQKQMNKHKPISIPGFKGTSQLQKKREYEQVKVGNQDNNKLILPQGFGQLTQEDIVQMLRQKKAKKELQRNKQNIQKNNRVVHNDFLANRFVPTVKQQAQMKQKMIQEKPEQKSFFKSQILQKIEKGQPIVAKKEEIKQAKPQQVAKQQQIKSNFTPKFIPRSLWNK